MGPREKKREKKKKKKREEDRLIISPTEEEAEEIGVRRRESKLILGARDSLKTQRFRLGFLLSSPYAYDTGTAGKLPCPCFLES